MDGAFSGRSFWTTEELPAFPSLDRDLDVDVLILGGGLTGVSAAYQLTSAGIRVALVERHRLGTGDTQHTTAHVTAVTDARPHELARLIGDDDAAAVWAAGQAAVREIERTATVLGIACDWRRVPGFLHVPFDTPADKQADEREALEQDAALAQRWGVDAAFEDRVPVIGTPGVRFPAQALFHPWKYLRGLIGFLQSAGVPVFEHSEPTFTEDAERLECLGHRIRAKWVLMATHNPHAGRQARVKFDLTQTKLALYTSHVVRARHPGPLGEGLYWDTADPYRYVRIEPDEQGVSIIAGGGDYKTGQASDARAPQAALERWVQELFPGADLTHRWSGQVIETPDATPFIGEVAEGQWIATGYAGNGMTFGTLAAMLMRDALTGVGNDWARVVSPDRASARRDAWEYLKENTDYPYYMLRRLLGRDAGGTLHGLQPGKGTLVTREGHALAAARDESGRLHLHSAVCPHLGCTVAWNELESTWDCPCHGSRFRLDGTVVSGPAERPLAVPPPSDEP